MYPERTARGDLLAEHFDPRCVEEREESPLTVGETVRVVDVSTTEPTLSQILVIVEWTDHRLGVPLKRLEPVDATEETQQPIEDWHYWVDK